MSNRKEKALELLHQISKQDYQYLGEGTTAVVFHNHQKIYRVLFKDIYPNSNGINYLLKQILEKKTFSNSLFLYQFEEIIDYKNVNVLIYPYEKSHLCIAFSEDEIIDFLVECWQVKILFRDLKPENFIRVQGKLKFIDYDPEPYTDNIFLNIAARAFIYCKYSKKETTYLLKLRKSAINQFDLPELNGLQEFMNKVFVKIIFKESIHHFPNTTFKSAKTVNSTLDLLNTSLTNTSALLKVAYHNNINPDKLFFNLLSKGYFLNTIHFEDINLTSDNYFTPTNLYLDIKKLRAPSQKVSLIIKVCIQDATIIYEAVKHIIKQTAFPNKFDEKIVALDIRSSNFLRSYNEKGSWEQLLAEVQRLIDDGIIERFIYPTEKEIKTVNKKWFGLDTKFTHTFNKIPVAAQLFAFDYAKNDYILQVDCDAMIGRLNHSHSFLADMLDAFKKDERVLSVGFNIYKGKKGGFTPYFGFENGGFVPEVRFCLLNKKRIEKILPLPNEITKDGLKLSWYRSMEQHQKKTNTTSIRGGDASSFYIHPSNFKKKDKDVWFTMVDRIEQLTIPKNQINQFDLVGAYHNWTLEKRNEEMIIVSCFRNISLSRFLRFWYSLISQSYQDWGLILIDDASENGLSFFIKNIITPYKHKITFIHNRFRMEVAHNTYKAIHHFAENQDSIIVIIDGDDALIGKNTLQRLQQKYVNWKADVVVGKMYRTDKLTPHYKYHPNFLSPRKYGGNVWQHLRSFKKYLFDSLGYEDLKIKNQEQTTDDILLAKRFSNKWVFPEHCWDFAYMIPIVEMSQNPMFTNHFNILHDRRTINTPRIKARKEAIIKEILSKKSKSPKDVFRGRKTFLPNLKKIEIDITYECNLKCINCNRSSTQAPINSGMSLEQIQVFVRDSIALNKKWELINLLGGEPTIHKDFLEIVNEILYHYIEIFSPDTILQITSNGYGELVQSRLKQLPTHSQLIIDSASFKDNRIVSYFSPFNDAPIDNKNISQNEYHKGCWVTSYCGIGLNQLGYYPCGVAGGIDRVFEMNLGVKQLKDVDKSIAKLLTTFCQYCGNFTDYSKNQGNFIPRNEKALLNKPIISSTWKKQYRKYNKNNAK